MKETVVESSLYFLQSDFGDCAVSSFPFNRREMGTTNNCRRHKTKSGVFLKFSVLLASKTYRFARTWTRYN